MKQSTAPTKPAQGTPTKIVKPPSREIWLLNAIEELRPVFEQAGYTIPDVIHVSMGFPSSRALSAQRQHVGECWQRSASDDGNHHIFISPVIADGVRALGILVHELLHACLPVGSGHKSPFRKGMEKLGLEGKPTATTESGALVDRLNGIMERIGSYPHAGIKASALTKKKQTTRLLKVTCPNGGDDEESDHGAYIVRMSQGAIDEIGTPVCPSCGAQMEEQE